MTHGTSPYILGDGPSDDDMPDQADFVVAAVDFFSERWDPLTSH